MSRSASYRSFRAARDAGLRVNMTIRQAFCAVLHAAGVHKASVGARDGYRRFAVPWISGGEV